MIVALIEGTEAKLCASAPKRAHAALLQFREDVAKVRTTADQKRYERRLERLLQSAPYFRAAATRYLTPGVIKAVKQATDAILAATVILHDKAKLPRE
jgi:hypothetical protein